MRESIDELIGFIGDRKSSQQKPYVLLLGAGASMPSGLVGSSQLTDEVIGQISDLSDDERTKAFDEKWRRLSVDDQYAKLKRLLKLQDLSPGYRDLAKMVSLGYFDFIFSTNIDQLLEDSLYSQGLRGEHFARGIVGIHNNDSIIKIWKSPTPQKKILKLHGDLEWKKWAFTQNEIFKFTEGLGPILDDYLKRDIIVVGHSLHDLDLKSYLSNGGDRIIYVNPNPLKGEDDFGRSVETISGDVGNFDKFFKRLYDDLEGSRLGQEQRVETRFDTAPPLKELGYVYGFFDYKGKRVLTLGRSDMESILVVSGIYLKDLTIEASFKILDDGGNSNNWAGYMLRSTNPFIGAGYLIYLRNNGNLEVFSPQLEILAKEKTSVLPSENFTSVKTEINSTKIRVYTNENTEPTIEIDDKEISVHPGGVFLHTYRSIADFNYLKVSG